jgi:hypothetical protein
MIILLAPPYFVSLADVYAEGYSKAYANKYRVEYRTTYQLEFSEARSMGESEDEAMQEAEAAAKEEAGEKSYEVTLSNMLAATNNRFNPNFAAAIIALAFCSAILASGASTALNVKPPEATNSSQPESSH